MISEDTFDDQQGPTCPICGRVAGDNRCKHVVSTWDYFEEGGEWAGDYGKPEELRSIVEKLIAKLEELDSEQQQDFVDRHLENLPQRLFGPLQASISHGDFDFSEWNSYLGGLVEESPGYAGSSSCFADGGGTSSDWTTYWAEDYKKCGEWLDRELRKDIEKLKGVAKALEAFAGDADGHPYTPN